MESEDASIVVVKKATPTFDAKSKTFKTKAKTKKYTVTFKNNKKQAINTKVYLKVKGITYTAKTNSKGQATFNLNKLIKKGKHTAVIMYKGSKYYSVFLKVFTFFCLIFLLVISYQMLLGKLYFLLCGILVIVVMWNYFVVCLFYWWFSLWGIMLLLRV